MNKEGEEILFKYKIEYISKTTCYVTKTSVQPSFGINSFHKVPDCTGYRGAPFDMGFTSK